MEDIAASIVPAVSLACYVWADQLICLFLFLIYASHLLVLVFDSFCSITETMCCFLYVCNVLWAPACRRMHPDSLSGLSHTANSINSGTLWGNNKYESKINIRAVFTLEPEMSLGLFRGEVYNCRFEIGFIKTKQHKSSSFWMHSMSLGKWKANLIEEGFWTMQVAIRCASSHTTKLSNAPQICWSKSQSAIPQNDHGLVLRGFSDFNKGVELSGLESPNKNNCRKFAENIL